MFQTWQLLFMPLITFIYFIPRQTKAVDNDVSGGPQIKQYLTGAAPLKHLSISNY